ncbi:diguanylate cyclase [Massilia sp. WF1]|uniref:sensor domain-containing diguanylate cyclase n=1 Tax=unclassified Massilia TaxID=2609279 RepID=UPI0006499ACF|nr:MULTISPECIES: sensor domain-containing diguanylate cyclase [unclassified Massilia]ALK95670.1 diguanylate cyclase [Massilia sp. WG5]KLU34823.1 diguanylate cyclase [Massilia sp. WF1]
MTATSDTIPQAKRPRHLRLAALMVSFSCLTVAITVLLQLLLADYYAIEHASEQARLRLQQLSWQMRDSLDRTLDQAVRDVYLLSTLPQVQRPDDPAATRRILDNVQHHFSDYAWIGLATADGKVVAATGGLLEHRDVSARPWFHTGQQGLTANDYHPAALLGQLLPRTPDPWRFVDVAGPIRNADGSLSGVLAIHLSWAWARSLARELLTPAQRDIGAEIIVVRSDGIVLLGPADILEKRISTSSLTLAQQGQTGAVTERWPDGRVYVTGYSKSGRSREGSDLHWAVLVRQTEQAAMASAHRFERRALWFSLLLGVILAGVAALLARRIVAPLKALSGAIENIAQAPEQAHPDAIPLAGGFHEAGVLSDALRGLIRSERRHHAELEAMNAHLEETVAARTAELQGLLMRDVLTGLPNRRALMQALPEAIARAGRLERPCAVLFLDMDGFKQINDTRGHEEGDELLRQFGVRIANCIRETDMAARLAGDEFVVILEMLSDAADAAAKAEYLLGQLSRPFILGSGSVQVGASIGVALQMPHQQPDPARLLACADQAMYEAKRKGKSRVAMAPAQAESAEAR